MTKLEQALDGKVQEAVDDKTRLTPHGIAFGAEVRAYVKGLPKGERMAWVVSQINEGQKSVAAHVLAGPSFLSGLTPEAVASIQMQAANEFAPKEYSQLLATRKAITAVQAAGSALMGKFGPIMVRGLNSPEAAAAAALKKLAG